MARVTNRTLALAVFAWLVALGPAWGQTWPARAVKIVVPFPPGASTDILARILAPPLARALGQQVIVENRAGAYGSMGTGTVARAEADGYTLLFTYASHATNPTLVPELPFDTRKDLAPIMMIGTSPLVLVASAKSSYASFAQVIAEAKRTRGAVTYGAIGPGGMGHLAMAQLANLGGFEWTYIPYKGGGPLMQDAIGGHVPLALGSIITVLPHVTAKTLRPLMVTAPARVPQFPDVPTVSEAGFPGFAAVGWWGYLAPAKVTKPIIDRLQVELGTVLKQPDIAEKLHQQGLDISATGAEAFGAFLEQEIERWRKVIRDNRITGGG